MATYISSNDGEVLVEGIEEVHQNVVGAMKAYLDLEATEFNKDTVDRESLSTARRNRDQLRGAQGLAVKRLAHVRRIFEAHDSKVDHILNEANGGFSENNVRLQNLHQALEARISAYLRLLRELSGALNVSASKQPANSDSNAGDWRSEYVDTVAAYVDDVAEFEVGETPITKMMQKVLALRIKRDLALGVLEMPHPQNDQIRVRRHLADYDDTIDALLSTPFIAQESTDSETLGQARGLFADRLKNETEARKTWLRVWVAGSALGLLAIVAAFWTSLSDPFSWSWITVCLAGLGALVAALYTFKATRELSIRANWILIALPFLVLAVALILPLQGRQTPAVATVVAVLTVAVLGGMSLWVVRHEPSESRVRSALTSHSLGLMRGSTSSGNETTDWDRYLVADELENLRARILQEARTQHKASIAWATTFVLVGGLAALLSGAAGVTSTQDEWRGWVVGLAIGGAGLTALMTALNPGRRWEQARTLQLACQSLEREVGILIRLDLGGKDPSDANGRQKIEQIAKMYDTLLGVPERPSLWRATPASERNN